MVLRLIVDFIARERHQFQLWIVLLAVGGPMVYVPSRDGAAMLAVSMSAAFCLGPLLVRRMVTREVFALPLSVRQLWLAKWWVGTAGAAVCTALPKLLFVGLYGLPFVLLSMLCDFAYTGACVALSPVFDIRPRGPLWLRAALTRGGMILWVLTIGGGAVAWTFVLRPVLPTRWDDLAGPQGLAMLAALGLTLLGYLHTPPHGAPRDVARACTGDVVRPEPGARRPSVPVRVTGIAYVLWRDARVALVYATIVVGGVLVASLLERPAGFSQGLDDAARVLVPRRGEVLGRSAWLVLLFTCFPAGLFWHAILRHVRTLPLSVARIVALLVAIPLTRWVAVWLVLAVLFVLDGRMPVVMRLDTLLAFAGIGAVIHAAGLRWNNARRAAVVLAVLAGGWASMALGVDFFARLEAAAAGLGLSSAGFIGLLTMGTAIVLNYDTLARRSLTYRSPHIGDDAFTPGLS